MTTEPTTPAPNQIRGAGAPPPAPVSAIPSPPRTQTAPQPLTPPEGSKPSVYAAPVPPPPPRPQPEQPPAVVLRPAAVVSPAPAQPAAPAARMASANQPAPARGPVPKSTAVPKSAVAQKAGKTLGPGRSGATPGPAVSAKAAAGAGAVTQAEADLPVMSKKRPLSKEAKTGIKTVGAIVVMLLVFVFIGNLPDARTKAYNKLVTAASAEASRNVPFAEKSIPVTKGDVDILLSATLARSARKSPGSAYAALSFAKAAEETDSEFDVDAAIVSFVVNQFKTTDVCDMELLEVLRQRKNPAVVPPLLEFCRTTGNSKAAIAAIKTSSGIVAEVDFPKFIDIIELTSHAGIRQAAEESAAEFLKKSINRQSLGNKVTASLTKAYDTDAKYSLIRLLGCAGGVKAGDMLKKALISADERERFAAVAALGSWPDDSLFETLINQLDAVSDERSRALVFDACIKFLANPDRTRSADISDKFWKLLVSKAKSPAEQDKIARARTAKVPGK